MPIINYQNVISVPIFIFSQNFPSKLPISVSLSLKIPLESQCICDKVHTSYLWLFFILDF